MAIRDVDKQAAEQQQWAAAADENARIRLAAGPGTGKSKTIEKRVLWALQRQIDPGAIYVISFTRATSTELQGRIQRFCAENGHGDAAAEVHVSTMHSLALTMLRRAGLLNEFPTNHPLVLDDWEQREIHDTEFARHAPCSDARAREIRLAHDANWQTLDEASFQPARITDHERQRFDAFHLTRTNLYCCVLPGELVFRCVRAIRNGSLTDERMPPIQHLIVDEFQDLNACDQTFVRLLAARGATLFVAGDDDQSIYSFRHANPQGIIGFPDEYPGSASHVLTHCFRCPPSVLSVATAEIRNNPNRVEKDVRSLLSTADPPVPGILAVWSFATEAEEASAIAESCRALVDGGMRRREDQIAILVASRGERLDALVRELANRGVPFEAPAGESLLEDEGTRSGFCLLRIVRDQRTNKHDYPAHRALLGLLHGVGPGTARETADLCIEHLDNFRDIFHAREPPAWLAGRPRAAVSRVHALLEEITAWTLDDPLADRAVALRGLVESVVGTGAPVVTWAALIDFLPAEMTLGDLLLYLESDSEAEQATLLDRVRARHPQPVPLEPAGAPLEEETKRLRLLTMHGAKGLDGSVVFIPWMEQGVVPKQKALRAAGLVMEQRRLFYVALTRTRAVCIVSHAVNHAGRLAFAIAGRTNVQLPRSQFVNEMGVAASENRLSGLTAEEAARLVAEVDKL